LRDLKPITAFLRGWVAVVGHYINNVSIIPITRFLLLSGGLQMLEFGYDGVVAVFFAYV
jgi:hypothetical protein